MAAIAQRIPAEMMLHLMDGRSRQLSEYRGRIVILQVMTTRCSRCAGIVKLLNELQRSVNVQPIAIAIDPEAERRLPEFVERTAPEFPVAVSSKTTICELFDLPKERPLYLPVIAFLDKHGAIRGLVAPGTEFFHHAETMFPKFIAKLQEDGQ